MQNVFIRLPSKYGSYSDCDRPAHTVRRTLAYSPGGFSSASRSVYCNREHLLPFLSTLLVKSVAYVCKAFLDPAKCQLIMMWRERHKRNRSIDCNASSSSPLQVMRNSELAIQLLVASAIGLPVLVLLGYVGLRQFRLLLTVVNELSASRSHLPAFLRPCKAEHCTFMLHRGL